MPGNTLNFEDGSALTWTSRESLQYTEPGYEVSIWVDMGAGFFSRKKVIKTETLTHWARVPPGVLSREIPISKQAEIIEKIRRYYPDRPVDVE